VRVDLASFADRLGRPSDRLGKNGSIETTNAATLVTLTPGETVSVGGLDRSRDASRQSVLRGASSASGRDDTILLLRAEIE
jgi:hypothetical protein